MKRYTKKQRHHLRGKKEVRRKKLQSKRAKRLPVLVDEAPIRKEIGELFHTVQVKLNQSGKLMEKFRQIHMPAYEKWRVVEFSTILSEIRMFEEKCRAIDCQLQEIGTYAIKYGLEDQQAYLLFCLRQADPERYQQRIKDLEEELKRGSSQEAQGSLFEGGSLGHFEEDEDEEDEEEFEADFFANEFAEEKGPNFFEFGEDDEEDLEFIFSQQIIFNCLRAGINPDNLTPEQLNRLRVAMGDNPHLSPEEFLRVLKSSPLDTRTVEQRLKFTFHRLAKKLHPDVSDANQTEAEKEIWYQVQAAYAKRDLEKLTSLEALLSLYQGASEPSGAVSDLYRALEHAENSLYALESEIHKARQHPAWKFKEKKNGLAKGKFLRVQKQIQRQHNSSKQKHESLERCFQQVQKPGEFSIFSRTF